MTFLPDCPLCSPDKGPVLWQDDRLRIVRVDDAPYPGFLRVIWNSHEAEMTDIDALCRLHLMRTVFRLEVLQRALLRPDKINLASLGNQVPHLHWHLIPRWRNDPCFPDAIWAAPRQDVARIAAWADFCATLAPRVARLHQLIRAHGPEAEIPDPQD